MILVTPNFHFNGQCKEAIKLYEKAFGAKVKYLMSYSEANHQDYVASEEFKDYVFHSEVYIGNQRMMLTDSPEKADFKGNMLSLVVTFDTAKEVNDAYNVLLEGATILSPMVKTSYSSCFVSLTDKFGMQWELMTEQTEC